MEILMTLLASAGLFVAVEMLWRRRGWLDGGSSVTTGDGPDGADDVVEYKLFSEDFMRRRLDALAAELERLDDDPDVFAKAFHTVAARSAYDALAADVSHRPRRSLRYAGSGLDLEITTSSHAVREVLDL